MIRFHFGCHETRPTLLESHSEATWYIMCCHLSSEDFLSNNSHVPQSHSSMFSQPYPLFIAFVNAMRPISLSPLRIQCQSSASKPPGILPSFNSFSNLAISAKLLALRMSSSTRLRSFSVNFTRPILSTPFAICDDAGALASNVRDLTLEI